MEARRVTWEVRAEDIDDFSGHGRTFPPVNLHNDGAIARSLGFADVVAQGLQQAAIVVAALRGTVGPSFDVGAVVRMRFVGPVTPGAHVTYEVAPVADDEGTDGTRFDLRGERDGRAVLEGSASVRPVVGA